jgi:hypothetical protein
MGGLISRFPYSLKKPKRTTFVYRKRKKEDGNKRVDGLIKH